MKQLKEKKRKKKNEIKVLKKKLDVEWSRIIRERDKLCRRCKKAIASQAAHIFSRNNMSVRWDLDNGLGMCYYCHIIWSHREPVEFAEWVKQELGEEKYNNLLKLSKGIKQWTKQEMENLLTNYKKLFYN